jgi:hypothetical protein
MTMQRLDVEEFVEPSRRGRIAALWVFGVGVAAALAMLAWWPVLMGHIRSLPVCDQLPWFQGVIALQALLMTVIPAVLLATGLAARRSGRWPPPRMPVLQRTRVRRGAVVQRRAWWLIGGAVATAVIFIALVMELLSLMADIAVRWQCT